MWWLFWVGYGVIGLVAAKIFYHHVHEFGRKKDELADALISLFCGTFWGILGPLAGVAWLANFWLKWGQKDIEALKVDKATREREKREAILRAERLNWIEDK